jgi:hypothetical protein
LQSAPTGLAGKPPFGELQALPHAEIAMLQCGIIIPAEVEILVD